MMSGHMLANEKQESRSAGEVEAAASHEGLSIKTRGKEFLKRIRKSRISKAVFLLRAVDLFVRICKAIEFICMIAESIL